MEALLFLIGATILLGPLVVAAVALGQARAARREISRLRLQVDSLGSRVAHLRAAWDQGAAIPVPDQDVALPGPPVPEPSAPPRDAARAPDASTATIPTRAEPPSPPPPPPDAPSPPAARPVAPAGAVGGSSGRAPVPPTPAVPSHAGPPFPPRPSLPKIDMERWLGVRGAALLGGIVLALAALLFFQYSIQHGLIPPVVRVVIGVIVGVGGILGSEWLRTRRYRALGDAVAGGSIVALYAAFWAAHALYELVGQGVAFFLMALVTVVAGLLSVRRSSLVVAVLGLIGGFATPLLLASGEDRPIGLFGYVLLLDLGLLAIARRRRWPSLGLLALAGTTLMQVLWIGFRMGPERMLLGLAILATFAVLFAFVGGPQAEGDRRGAWTQAAAILMPFVFAVYLAARVDLGEHLVPVAGLLLLLSAGAGWVGRRQAAPWLGTGAAVGAVGVVGVWVLTHPLDASLAWETVVMSVLLAAVFHGFVEPDREAPLAEGPAQAAILSALGMFLVQYAGGTRAASVGPWPWAAGALALAAMLYRHASFPGRATLQPAATVATAIGLVLWHLAHHGDVAFPGVGAYMALMLGVGLVFQVAAVRPADPETRRHADIAAALYPLIVLGTLPASPMTVHAGTLLLGPALLIGLLGAFSAARLRDGRWLLASAATLAAAHGAWTFGAPAASSAETAPMALGIELLAVVLFALWPLVSGLKEDRWAWYGAALAGPLWFLSARALFETAFGDELIGLLPLGLAAITLAALAGARRALAAGDPARRPAIVWLSAVALGFVAVAIPLQLDREWITIGWALEGLAVTVLWRRLDHPGLKWFGLALLMAVSLRLVANPALLGYHPRSSVPIFNWVLYTYLVPAACLVATAALLRPRERERARAFELPLYRKELPIGAIAAGVAAILVVFVWINVTIADYFGEGPALTIAWRHTPARDLTTSIAWMVYAMLLLVGGMWRKITGLRWASLVFLFLAIGKAFLYDLGELKDLYRVASLAGLAVTLMLVSFLYQRFVFRRGADATES